MEIRTSQLDMSDSFAQAKQRLAQAETVLQQMPHSQRRALAEALEESASTPQSSCVDGPVAMTPVAMTSVAVSEWDGGVMPRSTTPLHVRRPRQRPAQKPARWDWLVAAERFLHRLHRQWQRQSRALRREVRMLLRDPKRQQPRHQRRR